VVEAQNGLGNVLQAQGRAEEAIGCYERALAAAPTNADLCGNLASALQGQGRLEEAVALYRRAVAARPEFAEAEYNMGTALLILGREDEATECFERAVGIRPEYGLAWNNLGNLYKARGRFEEAMGCYRRVLQIGPESARAHYNLGCLLGDLGEREAALEEYRMALELEPGDAQVEFSVGLIQLLRGELAEGWRRYERRWQAVDHDTPAREYGLPLWQGERVAGKVLLWGEQGVGDEILFAGLVPDALRTGNAIVLDCDSRLKPLFARSFRGVEVVSGYQPGGDVAAQMPVGSLPGLFRRAEGDFTRTVSPYLQADPAERARFRTRYGDGRRVVGIAWFTRGKKSGRARSIALEALRPVLDVAGIRWVSLQYGDADALQAEVEASGASVMVERMVDQTKDMDRFAGQVSAMDLVVTIDNSAAHLAGALGVPTWVMLPYAPDQRWFLEREDSPWYPATRLFRQERIGEWGGVVERVREALVVPNGPVALGAVPS
jgi:Flp pilus assembly protein TadD